MLQPWPCSDFLQQSSINFLQEDNKPFDKVSHNKGKGLGTCCSAAYISRLKISRALQSRHYAAIHCLWWRTTGPAVQHGRYTITPISHTKSSPHSPQAATHFPSICQAM